MRACNSARAERQEAEGQPAICKERKKMEHLYEDLSAGIYLRPMTLEDTDNIVRWRNTDAVRSHFIYQELFTAEGHERWVHTMVETGRVVQMIICEADGDRPVGSVYIRDIDYTHQKGEYGIFIGEAQARGRGIGTSAAKLMLQYAFTELKLHRVFLRVFADNAQAIGSYERAGFVREACLRDDVCISGVFRDIVLMAALNPDAQNRKAEQ